MTRGINERRDVSRRMFLKVAASLPLAASAAGASPAYVNYFDRPVRPDRYLRGLRDLDAFGVIRHPSLPGRFALELSLRFTEPDRHGVLFWDLAPIRASRIRCRVLQTGAPEIPVTMNIRITDIENRARLIPPRGYLSLDPGQWISVDAPIEAHESSPAGPVYGPILKSIAWNFVGPRHPPLPSAPVRLVLEGLELY